LGKRSYLCKHEVSLRNRLLWIDAFRYKIDEGVTLSVPGTALVVQERYEPAHFERSLRDMIRERHVARIILNSGQDLALAYACYPEYPLLYIQHAGSIGLVEGAMVDPKEKMVTDRIAALLDYLEQDPERARRELETFSQEADGDFIVTLISPASGRALIANDPLGRLQLFYCATPNSFSIAREMKFLAAWTAQPQIDRHALADSLVFGWPLGDATLLNDVKRLPVASSVFLDWQRHVTDIRQYYLWNFESMEQPVASRPQLLEELTGAFVERCARQIRWAGTRPIVVSVSGGLDSRTVAAGYSAAHASYRAATYLDSDSEAARDAAVAEQVAKALSVPWELHRLNPSSILDDVRLVEMRDGCNYIGVSFFLHYLDNLAQRYGHHACQISGEMGQWLFLDMRGPSTVRTLQEFVASRLSNAIWPLEWVAKLLRLTTGDLTDRLHGQFERYPEISMRYRNIHFMLMERKLRYSLEGEERDRSVLWSMTPRGSPSFFANVMSVPAALKAHHQFYADFLRKLNPRMVEIPYADWNAPIGSLKARARSYVQGMFPRFPRFAKVAIKSWLLSGYRDMPVSGRWKSEFDVLIETDYVREIFDKTLLEQIRQGGSTRFQFQTLMTMIMYVAKVGGYDLSELAHASQTLAAR